jgi:hypothetical protein
MAKTAYIAGKISGLNIEQARKKSLNKFYSDYDTRTN